MNALLPTFFIKPRCSRWNRSGTFNGEHFSSPSFQSVRPHADEVAFVICFSRPRHPKECFLGAVLCKKKPPRSMAPNWGSWEILAMSMSLFWVFWRFVISCPQRHFGVPKSPVLFVFQDLWVLLVENKASPKVLESWRKMHSFAFKKSRPTS